MADLLDAAQKAIDDAAQKTADKAVLPQEPAPEPVGNEAKNPEPALPVGKDPKPEDAAALVDTLISGTSAQATPPPQPPTTGESAKIEEPPKEEPPPKPKKGTSKTGVIAALLLLFITLPLTVFYVQQQRQIADIRSQAAPPSSESACKGCAQNNYRWEWNNNLGECKKKYDTSCKSDNPPEGQKKCTGYGAAGCDGKYPGGSCGDGGECVMTNPDNGACSCQGQNKATPKPTVKPTPVPQCKNLKIYKDGVVVDPSTLKPGDDVVLEVKGTGATKGRIRVNGGTFIEDDAPGPSGEFTVDFTIPSGVTNFTIEGEVFINGAWK